MLNKKSVFATLFLVLITFVSCGDAYSPFAEMNFVKEYGWTDSSQIMASPIADTNNPEAIAELSSQVVICEISALDRAIVNGIGDLHFYYTATIKEILYDRDLIFTVGDSITVSSSEGILPANEAKALYHDSAYAKKYGVMQGEYSADDYVRSSFDNAIPIQVGETYLMYLTDRYFAREEVYAENGQQYLYLCKDNTLYAGREGVKTDVTLEKMKMQVSKQMAARTGRADEIGHSAYLNELGKRQAEERLQQANQNSD